MLLDVISNSAPTGFSFIHVNIQSLTPHLDELRCDLSTKRPAAVFLSETWLNSAHDDGSLTVNGYKLFRNDRSSDRRGGGVAIFLKNQYKARILSKSTKDGESEFLFIEVSLLSTNMLLGCIYKPPNCSHLLNFYTSLINYCGQYQHIIICGDLNINLLKSGSISNEYLSTILGLGLEVVNMEWPTHFQGEPSLLDHVLVSEKSRISKYQQLSTPYFSKHDLVFAVYDVPQIKDGCEFYSYRDFRNIDMNALRSDASNCNFSPLLMLPIDDAITHFQDQLNLLFDSHAPMVTKKKVDPGTPWMTSEIMYLRRQRDEAFRKFKLFSNPTVKAIQRTIFNDLRNKVVSCIRNAKINFYSRTFNSNLSTKQLWRNLGTNGVNNKPQVECTLSPNHLASLFFPVYNPSWNPLAVKERTTPSFAFECVTINQVLMALASISSNASGLDGVSIRFFKVLSPFVINIFTDFLNRCFSDSLFPTAWKISKVIPVPKGKPNEFRPISLVSSLSKVCERLMSDQITKFIDDSTLLSKFQSGFRKSHSCKTAVLHVANEIGRAIDQNQVAFLILIDFSKAFDTIIHQQLIRKLKLRFGFSSSALKLMSSYLDHRISIVVNQSLQSEVITNNMGVPQGSILGPLLFSMYAEDMEDIFEYVSPHFYADDTQLLTFCKIDDVASTIYNINKDLQNLLSWANDNGLRINSNKSQCVVISRRPLDMSTLSPISLGDEIISYEDKVVNLGIVMNSRLQWDDHLAKVSQTIFFGLRRLWYAAKLFPVKTKMDLVKSLLVPHIIYCDVIVGELNSTNFIVLERAFNSMVKFVYGLRKYDHISHVSKTIFGVGLREYLQSRRLLFMYNLIKTKKPSYLFDELSFMQSQRLRFNMIVPSYGYEQYLKSFFIFDVVKWNGLPEAFKKSPSINVFKEKLLSHYS